VSFPYLNKQNPKENNMAEGTSVAATPVAAATESSTQTDSTPVSAEGKSVEKVASEKAPKLYQVSIEGQTYEVNEQQLQRLILKGKNADNATKQAKAEKAAIVAEKAALEKAKALAKTNPEEFLRAQGFDPLEIARAIATKKLQEEQMSPEQIAHAKREAELAAREAAIQEHESKERELRSARLQEELRTTMQTQLLAEAAKIGLEPSNEMFYAVYEAVKEAYELGLPWDAANIVATAQEAMDASMKNLESKTLAGLTGPKLLSRLGPKVVQAVLQAKREEFYGAQEKSMTSPPALKVVKDTPKKVDTLSPEEALKQMRSMKF
jgi:hypothetical protein